jgi:hypothetical protein
MSDLRRTIADLATSFAEGVVQAVRQATLVEVLAETRASQRPAASASSPTTRPPARRKPGRASSVGDPLIAKIVATLKPAKGGLRSEELRARVGVDRKLLFPALTRALQAKQIRKTGAKRGTMYFVA